MTLSFPRTSLMRIAIMGGTDEADSVVVDP